MLDKLQVERERGITVKAQTAALRHRGYLLNLIDTPGHVDFSAEVKKRISKSLEKIESIFRFPEV